MQFNANPSYPMSMTWLEGLQYNAIRYAVPEEYRFRHQDEYRMNLSTVQLIPVHHL
jgi:hypothetical protein